MSDGIYIGMAGASARSAQLDSIADNLANAQTPGFKGGQATFSTVLAEANGANGYVVASGQGADLKPGPVVATGNALDAFPERRFSFRRKRRPARTAFTRDGRLSLDADGVLRSAGLRSDVHQRPADLGSARSANADHLQRRGARRRPRDRSHRDVLTRAARPKARSAPAVVAPTRLRRQRDADRRQAADRLDRSRQPLRHRQRGRSDLRAALVRRFDASGPDLQAPERQLQRAGPGPVTFNDFKFQTFPVSRTFRRFAKLKETTMLRSLYTAAS